MAKVYLSEKDWFVHYHYYSKVDGKYHRDKVRLQERGLTLPQKKQKLQELATVTNQILIKRNKDWLYHDVAAPSQVAQDVTVTLYNGVDLAAADTKISQERKDTFTTLKKHLTSFYADHPLYEETKPSDISESFINLFIDHLKGKGFVGKTINEYIWSIEKVSEYLNKKGIVKHVPFATKDYRLPIIKNSTGKYPPLTHAEKEKAFNYYREHHPFEFLFLFFMYYTCIRPGELHRLQIKNIDLPGRKIFIPWYNSKNGLSNYVQILDPLAMALTDFDLSRYPKNYYLFGSNCQPAKESYEGSAPSKSWQRRRKRMGIPLEKQMYGLKHTFNMDFVENNKGKMGSEQWEWLRRHNRHATVQQTQDYISEVTAYFLDETKNTILNYY